MPDIIQLLPDYVANQIAAGEVVQRPASVVKELMENAIDAGADTIRVIIRDAGKTLVQVVDNGRGMTDTDARMCFERHATSKIRSSDDLFHIVTKGFRGEALASIAAVAQVELRTRTPEAELGTSLRVEGSRVVSQEPVQCAEGSGFQVRNLFFNVPARRYFLKSEAIELRHIIDEFQRIALTHPDVEFHLSHNGSDLFNLPKTVIRQRIVHVFGSRYNERLVPVEESTDIVQVSGFVGKPDAAKKTRGEQFFFVNQRFIRNSYLHHAVMQAFEGLLPQGHFPLYLIYLTIDPAQIDINIHPTKTEVKFQDERAVYAILHAAVKRGLGIHNISPTLDFSQEVAIPFQAPGRGAPIRPPEVKVDPEYSPFAASRPAVNPLKDWFDQRERQSPEGWQQALEISRQTPGAPLAVESRSVPEIPEDATCIQVRRRYIAVAVSGGLLVVDQVRAHRRVLYEQYLRQVQRGEGASQQLLFPEHLEVAPAAREVLLQHRADLGALGFDIAFSGDHGVDLLGIPPDVPVSDAGRLAAEFISAITEEHDPRPLAADRLAWALASSSSLQYGQLLTQPEMKDLIIRLLQCEQPFFAGNHKPTMLTIGNAHLDSQFS